jgi:hypothetical protein
MAIGSRIKHERQRRRVIAAVMVVLLGGSTALAAWMAEVREPRFDPASPTHRFDPIALAMPSNWRPVNAGEGQPAAVRAVFEEHTGRAGERRIQVASFAWERPMAPLPAMRMAQQALGVPGLTLSSSIGDDGVSGLEYIGVSFALARQQTLVVKHVMTALTADSRHYLVLHLRGFGTLQRDDITTLRSIAMSVRDQRYRPDGTEFLQVGEVRLTIPLGMQALRPAGETEGASGALLVAPEDASQFYRIIVDRPPPADASSAPDVLERMRQQVERWLADRPEAREAGHLERGTLHNHTTERLILERGPTVEEFWMIDLGDGHGLLVRLIADRRAATVARQMGGQLVAGITVDDRSRASRSDQ